MSKFFYQVSQKLMLGTGTELFDFMADRLHNFLEVNDSSSLSPCVQRASINSG